MRKFWRKTRSILATTPQATPPTRTSVPWQRIVLSLVGILIIMFMWSWATNHLYALPPTSIIAFTSITNNSLYVIGALVIFFTTGRLIYEWKNETMSQIIQNANETFIEERKTIDPKHFDDLNAIP